MRFHSTIQDIAISILVLICCALLSLYGMVFFGMNNPSQVFSDAIIHSIQTRPSNISFNARVHRTFLKDIEFLQPTITSTELFSVTAEKAVLKGGLLRLASSFLFNDKLLHLELENMQVEVHLSNSGENGLHKFSQDTYLSR